MAGLLATVIGNCPPAVAETVIFTFSTPPTQGQLPNGGSLIADAAGNLYGTTVRGGPAGAGVVFRLVPPAHGATTWTETVLYAFTGGVDGDSPLGGVVFDGSGNLYGTTEYGGDVSGGGEGYGVVFKLAPPHVAGDAWTETVIHTFNAGNANPATGVTLDPTGHLFGTTYGSGTDNGDHGSVFRLTPAKTPGAAWTYTVLHRFSGGADGAFPQAPVQVDTAGHVFGTTEYGGSGVGVVFELSAPTVAGAAWTETVLHTFTGGLNGSTDGSLPTGPLLMGPKGQIVGTSVFGGGGNTFSCTGGGCGSVYELSPPAVAGGAWQLTILHAFTSAPDGSSPEGGVVADRTGALYGTTYGGGTGFRGSIFRIKHAANGTAPWPTSVLHSFKGGKDSANPSAGLLLLGGAYFGTAGSQQVDAGVVFDSER